MQWVRPWNGSFLARRALKRQGGDSGDEVGGDAHHANEADDGCKRQGFAGQTDHVNNSRERFWFVLFHVLFPSVKLGDQSHQPDEPRFKRHLAERGLLRLMNGDDV
jgi:hypothetical protein